MCLVDSVLYFDIERERPLFSLSFEFNCHMHLYYVAGFCVASVLPYVFTTILKHEVFAFNADLYAIDNCLCNSLQTCSKSSIEVLSKQISAVTAKAIWKKFTKFRKEAGIQLAFRSDKCSTFKQFSNHEICNSI